MKICCTLGFAWLALLGTNLGSLRASPIPPGDPTPGSIGTDDSLTVKIDESGNGMFTLASGPMETVSPGKPGSGGITSMALPGEGSYIIPATDPHFFDLGYVDGTVVLFKTDMSDPSGYVTFTTDPGKSVTINFFSANSPNFQQNVQNIITAGNFTPADQGKVYKATNATYTFSEPAASPEPSSLTLLGGLGLGLLGYGWRRRKPAKA